MTSRKGPSGREEYYGSWPEIEALPVPPDKVRFTVTSPPAVVPGQSFILDVWAHMEHALGDVMERAAYLAKGERLQVASKGPVVLARGSNLTVRLRIDGLVVEEPEDSLFWDGQIANASFLVRTPAEFAAGSVTGRVGIYLDHLQIAKLYFQLWTSRKPAQLRSLNLREQLNRRAFASYASSDRDRVLGRIQGMQKVLPNLEVFLDVMSLRSGSDWEQRLMEAIPQHDVFYLFWSQAASQSPWVRKEWQCALDARGLEFIDPVPLESPEKAPPPPELSGKHFNDWVLAYHPGA